MIGSQKATVKKKDCGFTLVEMAIVLMIVGLLLGGMLVPLSAQMDQRNVTETRKQLDEIQQALIGFAVINGRLPCPASSTSNGVENPVGGGNCSNFYNGFVPAATLGLASVVDSQGNTGFAVDSWGNRIHYAVTKWSSMSPSQPYVFTSLNGMSTVGISNLSPDLLVCSTATGITGSPPSCASGASLTSNGVPAVIYSTGKNGGYGGTGLDEAENPNPNSADNDRVFVSHTPTPTFDDLVVWISPNILLNRMVAAGKLP
jgi:prepilin-type N-terminal cleavage/methylation domain-containing protein